MAGIGMGGQGSGDLGQFMGDPRIQVVAVCDVKNANLERITNTVNNRYNNKDCKGYVDYREVISRGDIDMILCATPDHWHAQISIDAMKAGKDVYCEKPLTLTIGEGRKMVDVARQYGRVFSSGSQRVIGDYGALAIKTGCWDTKNPGDNMEGVPVLNLVGQYSEWGSGDGYGEPFGDAVEALAMRRNPKHLTAFAVEWGGGHFEWSENCARLTSLFIRKAAKARLPDQAPSEGPVKLKEIDPSSGWLMRPYFYPAGPMHPYPAKEFPQDKRAACWYFDEEFANACRDITAEQRSRKIQKLSFMREGKPVGYADHIKDKTGLQYWGELVPESDGITYRFNAGFLDTMPARFPKAEEPLGHAPGPVQIICDVGPFEPVGDGAFRLKFSRFSCLNPVAGFHASHPGNKEYAASVAPIQAAALKKNTEGKPQRITFAEIPDVKLGTQEIKLQAVSDSGEKVEYFVLAGPAVSHDGNFLRLTEIPPRSKFPVKVTVVAWQFGRSTEPKLQTAEMVERSCYIMKDTP